MTLPNLSNVRNLHHIRWALNILADTLKLDEVLKDGALHQLGVELIGDKEHVRAEG